MFETILRMICISGLGLFLGLGSYCTYKAVAEKNDTAALMAFMCGAALFLTAFFAGALR